MPSAAAFYAPVSTLAHHARRRRVASAPRRPARRTPTSVLAPPSRIAAPAATGGTVDALKCDAEVARAVSAGAVVVLKLHARSCRACIGVAPRYRKMARAYAGRARFVEMELTASAGLAAEIGVHALPYFAVYKEGRLVASEALALPRISKLGEHVDKLLEDR